MSLLLVLGEVLAGLAALLHVVIFLMESVAWRRPTIWRRFGLGSQDEADTVAPMAFNQGFYNLFLAVGVAVGAILTGAGSEGLTAAGTGIVVFSVASMLAAALVLVLSSPKLWRAALTQGLLPLAATIVLAAGLLAG